MRKKLLRSRSGFEKPESREEAIMQNILGASNVLEPSESNIEEILKSILYNTPYTKEAEFEIEKILLAIKNNGTYDGECESRDLKILFAILNDLDYTEEAESRIEELFIEWLHQRSSIKVLEGVPPLTFIADGTPLLDYLISGNTVQNGTPTPDNPIMPEGTGERTENLAYGRIDTANVFSNGTIVRAGDYDIAIGRVESGIVYTVNSYVLAFYTDEPATGSVSYDGSRIVATAGRPTTFTAPITGYVAFRLNSGEQAMLNIGSTAKPFEPYGYKIPILSNSTTTPVYLGEVQTTRAVKKLVLTGEEIILRDREREGSWRFFTDKLISAKGSTGICSHFENIGTNGVNNSDNIGFSIFNNAQFGCRCPKSLADTVTNFKAYLAAQYAAGTPVTVWYVLESETTGIVNEPLMRIGDYADTLSMEQAGVEIPTVNGSNTLDVDTTLKPSNIYIEYK